LGSAIPTDNIEGGLSSSSTIDADVSGENGFRWIATSVQNCGDERSTNGLALIGYSNG
jgi:hypothetical protein